MKKLNYLFASFFIIAALVSCTKEMTIDSENESMLKSKKVVLTEKVPSSPASEHGVTPYIIPGENKGGNRTCAEVGTAFTDDANYFDLCGDRVDYEFGVGSFAAGFPYGLNVTVDGNFISFEMDNCIRIDGIYYKVGAVIVKGSNNANVYFYEDGTLGDSSLAAPEGLNMVSNLTFCFVECEADPIVIAVKSYYWPVYTSSSSWIGYTWATSSGSYIFNHVTTAWCYHLGISYYPETSVIPMLKDYTTENVGTVTVTEAWPEGVHSLIVTVVLTLNEGLMDKTFLYVGSMEGLLGDISPEGCPAYTNWMTDMSDSKTHIFIIPFDEIN